MTAAKITNYVKKKRKKLRGKKRPPSSPASWAHSPRWSGAAGSPPPPPRGPAPRQPSHSPKAWGRRAPTRGRVSRGKAALPGHNKGRRSGPEPPQRPRGSAVRSGLPSPPRPATTPGRGPGTAPARPPPPPHPTSTRRGRAARPQAALPRGPRPESGH